MSTPSPMETTSPIDEQYKMTAVRWADSDPPVLTAVAIKEIYKFANGAPDLLLQRCEEVLNTNPSLPDTAINLISHFVSKRWGNLSDDEKQSIFPVLPRLIASAATASTWSTKKKMAFLLSQLVRKDMAGNWEKLIAASTAHLLCDEITAEKSIVTCLSEARTIPNDLLKDKRSREMQNENWDWLFEVLTYLLRKHLGMYNSSDVAATQQHYDFSLYIANTTAAYAQWGDIKDLVNGVGGTELIISWMTLLSEGPFFRAAFGYLSEICLRVQSTDCDHDALMRIFYKLCDQFKELSMDSANVEASRFRERICLSLVSVKNALGPHFSPFAASVASLFGQLEADGSITGAEYCRLSQEVCGGNIP